MKKISLITLQYINNYGSVLQTFASQEYLEAQGCSVEIVNYTRENCRLENLKKSMKAYYKQKGLIFRFPFVSDLLVIRWQRLHIQRNAIFDGFRRDRVHLSKDYPSVEMLFSDPPAADFYCVGSDQVWNYLYNDGVLPEYYLQYAPKDKKKFSLASSFGIDQIEDSSRGAFIKKYLDEFSLITVREKSAVHILDELGFTQKHQILDPTLLLDKETWITKLALKKPVDYKYVLVYQLNPCKEMDEFAKAIARKKQCRLIVISNNIRMSIAGAEIIGSPAVEQFLSLILYADCVITDSFHGTAFSLNFNKDFFSWLPRKYSTRLTSVLELVGLSERAFRKNDSRWETVQKIDYGNVNKILTKCRYDAGVLIEGVLNGDER